MSDLVGNPEDRFSSDATCGFREQDGRSDRIVSCSLLYFLLMLCNIKPVTLSRCLFLTHLSRRLIGELIVYEGVRCPSSVRLSTFSNDISSEAVRPILFIFHIKHL